MFTMALALLSIGFVGLHGLIGFLVGLVVFIIIGLIVWKIAMILLKKAQLDADWTMVIVLILELIVFLIFLDLVGIWPWLG